MGRSGFLKYPLLTVLLLVGYSGLVHRKTSFRHFIKSNIEQIAESQEDTMGIDHSGLPGVVYGHNRWKNGSFARYEEVNDCIYPTDGIVVGEGSTVIDKVCNFATAGKFAVEGKNIIDHMLGYRYAEEVYKAKGKDTNRSLVIDLPDEKVFGLIEDGIATYFDFRMNGENEKMKDENEWEPRYWKGYEFVKPIIDKYGKNGIDYMVLNCPTYRRTGSLGADPDTFDLGKYQQSVLVNLKAAYPLGSGP